MNLDFFEKYPNLDKEEFLKSIPPFLVDSFEEAMPFYIAHMKALEVKDPDHDVSINRLKKSITFIYKFCKEKNIDLTDYSIYTEAVLPCWVEHLRTHKISFYSLHALTFSKPELESDLLEFVIPKFFLTFQKTRNKFYSSSRMKPFSKKVLEKISQKLTD